MKWVLELKVGDKYIFSGKVITIILISNNFVHFKLQGSNTKNYATKEFFIKTFIPITKLNLSLL